MNLVLAGPLAIDINGLWPFGNYDQLSVYNVPAVQLGGPLVVNVGYSAAVGDTFMILYNPTHVPILGTFAGLPEGEV